MTKQGSTTDAIYRIVHATSRPCFFVAKLRDLAGRQAFISTKKAERAFGWKAEHSWTEYLPAGISSP